VLWVTGFLDRPERELLARLLSPAAVADRLRGLREAPAVGSERAEQAGALGGGTELVQEMYEAEARDEDRASG
jgi:hypothetical protein